METPTTSLLKCNVDIAYCDSKKIAAVAEVIHDSNGKVIISKVVHFPCFLGWLTEALALREGLVLTANCWCDSILMESNSLEVFEACRNSPSCSEISSVVEDISNLWARFSQCSLLWTPHEANEMAHIMARLQLARNLVVDWLVNRNSYLQRILARDALCL